MTLPEEIAVLKAVRQGDRVAMRELIEAHYPLCVKITKAKTYRKDLFLDFAHEGIFGILVAAKKFCFEKNYRFITYAGWWILEYVTSAQKKEFKYDKLFTTDIFELPETDLGIEDSGFDQGLVLIEEMVANSRGLIQPLQRNVLIRYYKDCWTDQSIADAIGVSLSWVRSARRQALQTLKENTTKEDLL